MFNFFKKHSDIPKTIHQIHLGKKPLSNKEVLWQSSWKQFNPEWNYVFWDEEKISKDLKISHPQILNECKSYSEKSDILRFEILYQYGGLYIDTDFECYKNIDSLFKPKLKLLIYKENNSDICGAFFASTKHNPLVKKLIENLPARSLMAKNSPAYNKYGPKYLTSLLNNHHLPYGKDTVYPYCWDEKDKSNENFKKNNPKLYAAHHWAGSWT